MSLEEDNQRLREQLAERDERIAQQESQLGQQRQLIEQLQAQMATLTQQMQALQDRLAKNSRNSSLPPSSDRFGRQPKSLRKKSEKPSGGQAGHPGTTLQFSQTPDEVIEHQVTVCASCQQDLR
jgi:transposase